MSQSQIPSQSQKENIVFRIAQASDNIEISNLVNSAYRGDVSKVGWTTEADLLGGQRTDPEAIAELIAKPNNYFLLGILEGKIVGSLQLEKVSDRTCYFGMFSVNPKLQNAGVGKKMMAESERFAKEALKCQFMEMTVITVRQELISYYERRGYKATGEVRPFPYGDERFGIPKFQDIKLGVFEKKI